MAWLFNLRGSDVPFNPVFRGYAVITEYEASLYIDESQLSEECKLILSKACVAIRVSRKAAVLSIALGTNLFVRGVDVRQFHHRAR